MISVRIEKMIFFFDSFFYLLFVNPLPVWLLNPFTTGNPFLNPFLGTKLLGFSIGRGSGALKGLKNEVWVSLFVFVLPWSDNDRTIRERT